MSHKKNTAPDVETVKKWMRHIVVVTGYGLLFFFLILNVVFSQDIPSLYFQLTQDNSNALTDFMKQAKEVPAFRNLLPEIKQAFSEREPAIYAEERARLSLITKLETALKKNPQSSEILYSLYLLYDRGGYVEQANQYLERARSIDPQLGYAESASNVVQ
ncbi:hypothetical protein KAZ66_05785 [Candidatus Woesebacteria bacterium]|nr:hypothetical protein [Candidatus Woesebacteria bacterium]MCC7173501.1 hypothetical protein [Planctomycetota bacterium]